jgi:ribonuclease D
MDLLKQVRRDISNTKQLRLGSIARNDTLEILARKRPHNLEALKKATASLTTRERNKLDKY